MGAGQGGALAAKVEREARRAFEGDAGGHDWWHTDRVRRMALRLARAEGADPRVCELAALLHDVADWKRAGGDEDAAARAAAGILRRCGASRRLERAVAEAVGQVSFKGAGVDTPVGSLEAAVVQDADRLDALGAIGAARAFAYGGSQGRPMHDPAIPPRLHADFWAYRAARGTTINHFHEKLLLLKDRMRTRTGRRIAAGRHRTLQRFLRDFQREWDQSDIA